MKLHISSLFNVCKVNLKRSGRSFSVCNDREGSAPVISAADERNYKTILRDKGFVNIPPGFGENKNILRMCRGFQMRATARWIEERKGHGWDGFAFIRATLESYLL